ncbi:MAG TPA: CDP-alcohol phosphatidyltransferase family protein [Candidatus Binatia bacterium]
MKTAVILPPTAASFQTVAGLPLIQRTVLSAARCDFDRIVVLGNGRAEPLRTLLAGDKRTRAVEVTKGLSQVEGSSVTVIPSDRLLTAATLARVNAASLDGRPLLFGAGGRHDIAVCRPGMLSGIDLNALAAQGADAVWAALHARGAQTLPLDGEVCLPVGDEHSAAAAELALCKRLRADSAASDGPLAHWIDRRISLRISRWLANHTRVRPNHITIVGTSIGLLAAATLSVGTYWAGVAGTLLFLCATILDGCDGEVARLTFFDSPFGEKFDVITDNIVHVAIFIGLALGLYHQNASGHYPLLISILLGGFACDTALSYFFLVRRPGFARSGGAPVTLKGKVRRKLLGLFEAMMNRDFAYLLLVLAVVDRLYWFFWGAAFGTYLFAILLVWIYRWRDAA